MGSQRTDFPAALHPVAPRMQDGTVLKLCQYVHDEAARVQVDCSACLLQHGDG